MNSEIPIGSVMYHFFVAELPWELPRDVLLVKFLTETHKKTYLFL